MSVVVLSTLAQLQVEISQYARNGKQVPAELQSRIAEMIGAAAWVRTKEVFARSTPIANIPSSTSGQRKRWRFAFHTGPYTRTLLVWMELAPQTSGGPSSPYGLLQVAARSAPSTIVAQAKVSWGSSDGSYPDVPINFGGGAVLLVDPADGVTPVSLDADTDYVATVSDFDYARVMSCTAWEVSLDPDTDDGWPSVGVTSGAPIYDSDRSAPALMLRNLWKRGAQQLYNWCSETDASAPIVTPPASLTLSYIGENPFETGDTIANGDVLEYQLVAVGSHTDVEVEIFVPSTLWDASNPYTDGGASINSVESLATLATQMESYNSGWTVAITLVEDGSGHDIGWNVTFTRAALAAGTYTLSLVIDDPA